MKVTYPTIGLIVLLLSSCTFTPYNTDFECPLEKGVPCTRLSKINRMVDRGELGLEEEDSPHGLICNGACSVKSLLQDTSITYFDTKETQVPPEHLQGEAVIFGEEDGGIQSFEVIKDETAEEGRDLFLENQLLATDQNLEHVQEVVND